MKKHFLNLSADEPEQKFGHIDLPSILGAIVALLIIYIIIVSFLLLDK